jgi:hypothetical protein
LWGSGVHLPVIWTLQYYIEDWILACGVPLLGPVGRNSPRALGVNNPEHDPQPPPIVACVTGDIGRWGQRISWQTRMTVPGTKSQRSVIIGRQQTGWAGKAQAGTNARNKVMRVKSH